ncbi:quinoprotein relay system zinc metallohydrolase 2 [Paracoccus sp. Z330]|uniref:Quinoprotein relay system zinc metallohydrolase 2 n=1 Tax=Paracoccus onchidii TaxID=3017813 RepID=A0ABT4ZIQ6_9RHOB|nr:quinoprotein relay system zinc metallohydrolase 2 [Paracoccus onchidii]MDB6179245.1 quinoprotein relay system zinc metallohydrolase 2 [Paracoccus onchidii]
MMMLPEGERATRSACQKDAVRIADAWLASHPELTGRDIRCQPTEQLPALDLAEIAPGVHFFQGRIAQMDETPDGRIANLGVVIGRDGIAVIDAGVSRQQAQEFLVAIRRISDKPISHVILTHMHPDHVLGASFFAEAGAQVLAHSALPLALASRSQSYLDSAGRLFGPARMIGTEVVLPDQSLSEPMALDLGGRSLLLQPVKTAHTDNDLTVFDEQTATLFTGDLLFRELTPVVDGSLLGWIDWAEMPVSQSPALIVPGHGPVARDFADAIAPQKQFLSALRDSTRASIDAGLPMSRAVPEIVQNMSHLREGWQSFDATVARDATAAFKELEWED